MATITIIKHTDNISPSKAAEIYREDCGRIFYVCFHCGDNFVNIAETLEHIDIHFSAQTKIETEIESVDFIDIKDEIFDASQEVDPTELEQIFIDCSTKTNLINEDECDIVPGQQRIKVENLSDMDGLFEWKCLYCRTVLKKFEKLKLHLMKHVNDPASSVQLEATTSDNNSIKAQFSFKCSLCSSEFFDSSSPEQHLKDFHDARPPMKFIPYGKKFISPELLNEHMSTTHRINDDVTITAPPKLKRQKQFPVEGIDDPSKCIFCEKTEFNGILDLLQHIFGHFTLKIFSCPECPTKYQRMSSINDHMKKKHSLILGQKFECRFCKVDNSFKELIELVVHSFTYHLDEGDQNNTDLDANFNYDCRFCFMNFTKWLEASIHLKIHADDELVPPPIVGNIRCFTERAKSGIHRNELFYNCSDCIKTLCGSFEARKHQINFHKQQTKNEVGNPIHYRIISSTDKEFLKCYECNAVVESQYYLKKHILMHFNVQPYTCTVCMKTFSFSSNAVRHMSKAHLIKPNDSTRLLNCRYCKAKFIKDSNFISHMFDDHLYINFNINENLDGECNYECVYCSETFMERNSISKHLLIHKNEKILKKDAEIVSLESINALRHVVKFIYCCLHCLKKFRLPHAIREHMKYTHKIESKDKAKECKQVTTRDTDGHRKVSHVKDITKIENNDKLEECDQLLTGETNCTTRLEMELQKTSENNPEDYEQQTAHDTNDKQKMENKGKPKDDQQPTIRDTNCSLCGEAFPSWRSMINHRSQKHPETINTNVKTKSKNSEHKSKNAGQCKKRQKTRDTHCSLCNFTFESVRSFVNHRTKKHPELHADRLKNRPSYTCTTCGKTFRERSNYNHHTETHTHTRSYTCDICNKTYRLKNSLQTHMLKHTNEKNFVCEQCGKSFYTVSKLNLHNQVHENLTFNCEKCHKVFFTRNNFSKHKKTHNDNVRKECTICNNTFKSSVSLRVHMLLHSDTKKYACRFCDLLFTQSSGRRGHERLKHGFQ